MPWRRELRRESGWFPRSVERRRDSSQLLGRFGRELGRGFREGAHLGCSSSSSSSRCAMSTNMSEIGRRPNKIFRDPLAVGSSAPPPTRFSAQASRSLGLPGSCSKVDGPASTTLVSAWCRWCRREPIVSELRDGGTPRLSRRERFVVRGREAGEGL